MLDINGHVVSWNPAAVQMKGYTTEEILGRHFSVFYTPAAVSAGHPQKELAMAVAEGRYHEEGARVRKDGSHFWADVTISVLCDDKGQHVGFVKFTDDITERKRSEELIRASLEEKEIMLKEIHHRVKNNLQIVSSLLHMCSQSTGDAGVRELFRESENRVLSMAAIHECLYASSGFDVSDFGRIDLAGYLRRVVDNVAASYGHLGVLCSVEAEPDTSVPMGTAMPCGLIVNELVSNALKYAFESRSGRVRVSIQKLEATLLLRVDDDGAGLPESFQFGNTGGFGLQLVRALTKQLHGELGVHRENGTRFEIEFPIAVQSAPVIN